MRRAPSFGLLLDLFLDLRFAARLLLRQPYFTVSALLSLALGIGLNVSAFSLIDALLLRPLPGIREPDRLVSIRTQLQGQPGYLPVSYPNYRDLEREQRSLSALAGFQSIRVALSEASEAKQVLGQMVTWRFFEALGVRPQLGRFFGSRDDDPAGAQPIVVLSDGMWRRLGADPRAVGREIQINRHPFIVVGIAPAGFRGPDSLSVPQLWVPLGMYRQIFAAPEMFPLRDGQILLLVGRLKPGLGVRRAAAEMATLATGLARAYPAENRNQTLAVIPFASSTVDPNGRARFVQSGAYFMGVTGLLLLVACANLASLLLSRALTRWSELALRLALGAGRLRLVRQLLTESLLLALVGGGLGLVLALPGARLLWRFRPPLLPEDALGPLLDARVFVFSIAVTLVTGVLFGLAPALQAARPEQVSALKSAELAPLRSAARLPLGSVVVILQVALSFTAVACAAAFLGSLYRLERIDPGFNTAKLLTVSLDFQSLGYDEAFARDLQGRLRERIAGLPGVQGAAFAENRVLGGFRVLKSVALEAPRGAARSEGVLVGSTAVDASYHQVAGIPIVSGRAFSRLDGPRSPPVAIVDQILARHLWPGHDPLGRRLYLDQEGVPVEIVGVAHDAKIFDLGEQPVALIYLPMAQRYSAKATLHVLAGQDPRLLVEPLKRAVRELDANLPLGEIQTGQRVRDQSLWWREAAALLLFTFSGIAVFLVTVGIYGVTSSAVVRKRSEIGVRLAIGAPRSRVLLGIVRQGAVIALLGVGLGLPGALTLQHLSRRLLYGMQTTSALTLVGLAAGLLTVSFFANLLPAVGAVRTEPAIALRQ